ncbi:MAG: serine O-acetyltransferase [Spongiibacter sp.]|uniref:Serine acetyltransferase n=1 Tax=Spongiibacter thalassae TaxID=2721624 RepID=A0ABX1GJX1_9GAMM|nr:serine O-acetyltransferase [Spongiibacter thalassae]MDX1505259.1 serine O-acetyltransferase [Spongiibacter sp.]NKI19510.1 serine O-acetyltransferase [Spongiibacter thalassae]
MNTTIAEARINSAISDKVWLTIREETALEAQREPVLASFLHATILNHNTLEHALSYHLAHILDSPEASSLLVREVIEDAFAEDSGIARAIRADICAVFERDSACKNLSVPFLYFKGYHALQSYRVAHWLWQQGRTSLALFFQNRISCEFGVDIHPAARIGHGVMMDHATGIVIGETAVVGNNVSLMQAVTLGGTGKEHGDRHPKVADNVLISAGAKILGNIHIGEGSHVAAGSVVLKDVPPHSLVAGVPAKVIGTPDCDAPALSMNHSACCDDN